MIRIFKTGCLILLFSLMQTVAPTHGAEGKEKAWPNFLGPVDVHGFLEMRGGTRTRDDPEARDISVMEVRLQADLFTYTDWAEFKFKGDVWADGVTEKGEGDVREAWVFSRPSGFLDLKIGRQVLTWGTGDLVFLNDLFPKDWQSYFIGRDSEYLKAPSDAAKISLFTELANLDLVYTPRFDPDRYITGEYISYWDVAAAGHAGRNDIIHADRPDRWFEDDELAVRLYRNISNYELAVYGYWGFWKRPGGQTVSGTAIFPELNVYGASIRGQVAGGIGNLELAYYDSAEDSGGGDPLIDNSEIRYVVGYTRDLAMDLNASLQYYVEQLLDYGAYEESLSGIPARDAFRHVITLQITQLLMNQTLALSLSGYYSPSDKDTYLRPKISYDFTDSIILETGANIFMGEVDHTFFGQFENNTNVYAAVRYSL
ncbi:conserved exported hypothetical protein [Desulfosarcina cetonica]|uniref:hypothetical protein n=1 Tax=Desulfosarcina cetonica TaxID=90730 RepID=UPI0006D28F19|nr:hypothetical protein [Desulfosarcina cetonica]VTR68348.1 conserved exported hypothetical protein [Desulfosarcina cetonica]